MHKAQIRLKASLKPLWWCYTCSPSTWRWRKEEQKSSVIMNSKAAWAYRRPCLKKKKVVVFSFSCRGSWTKTKIQDLCSFYVTIPRETWKRKKRKSLFIPEMGDQRNECTQVSLVNLGLFAETQSTQRQMMYHWKAHPTIGMTHEPTGASCPTCRQLQGAFSSLAIADCLYYYVELILSCGGALWILYIFWDS